jgi:zinc/manganese transport system substrate-binding protein
MTACPYVHRISARFPRRTTLLASLLLIPASSLAGCQGSTSSPATDSGTPIQVVAAEGIWGDIAGQIGGTQVHVTTILGSATTDPGGYQPTAAETKVIGSAQVFILTGAGLDPWANQAAGADPGIGRLDVNVGNEVGVAPGGDPYLWYNPAYVRTAARQIEADFITLRPQQTTYFQQQEESFEQGALNADQALISTISTRYGGTKVGACTELGSAFAAQLGLKPDNPVTAAQISGREVRLLLCDAQKPGPGAQALLTAAATAGIPVIMLSESLEPAGATYQQWLSGQLQAVEQALS